ncbi:MAG: hypothetical protein IJ681_02940 [Bacteroidales bacterium]|nr:hypothetical protein [Bacteroidales bacterium]
MEIDENGNFDNEDFIDRKTTLLDGTEIFVVKENGRLTETVKKVGKPEVTTVYNGDNVQDLDSKKLNRLKQNDVYYDGKGNTYVQINAGETAQIMADRINKKRAVGSQIVTAQQIIELNPNLVKKNGEFVLQKFENGVKGLGEVRVPGEFDANSPFIKTRQSVQKANNLAIRAEVDRQVAKKVTESTNKKFAAELANNGFKPTRENAVFYKKFNALNPTQQQNVLSVIKYCKNQKITDPNKIKARILATFPEINLFDSGKTIPQTNNNVPLFQRKNPVALETFLTETLKLDLKSETGAMVYEKLSSLPQEALNKINAQNFSDLSKANFVEIAKRFEANGVDIRTRQEHQIENNSPRMKAEQEKRELRESASKNIALAYDNAINIIKQYQGNQGWINVGFYREKLGKLLSNVNPTKINTCFDDVIKELEKEKKFAVGYLKGKSTNDKEFKEAFKKISGGVEYNEANMKAFLDVAQDQSANFEDEKYNEKFWNAYNKAFGVAKTDKNGEVYYEPQVVKQATSRTNFQQYVDGAGDIVLMLLGTEAIGKGVAWAGGKLISKVSPYVPKFLANAGSKTVMTIGSNNITVGRVAANMASQSASFTLWDASKNYINLKTKDIQYSGKDAEKEWEAYKEGNVESAKFGAFAGALNTTVVGKVINGTMKMFEKPIAKAISKVGKSFEKTSAMSGSDVMKTFMLNQTPGALAKTAGTIAEIGGFTLYETANEVIEELLKKGEGGHLPAKLTEDGLTSYLLDKLGDQAKNLGEIKAISRLIFMHKGAIQEQARLMDENLAKCETLKNVKIKKTEVNGREIFEVTLPDGSRKVANSVEEVIANCNVLMQLDMISNAAKENETVDKKTTPQGMNAEEDAVRIENSENKDISKQIEQLKKSEPEKYEIIKKYQDNPNFDNAQLNNLIEALKYSQPTEINSQLEILDYAIENKLDLNRDFYSIMSHATMAENTDVLKIKTDFAKELLSDKNIEYSDIRELLDSINLKQPNLAETQHKVILNLLNNHKFSSGKINNFTLLLDSKGWDANIIAKGIDNTLNYLKDNGYKYNSVETEKNNPLKKSYIVKASKDGKQYNLTFTNNGDFVKSEYSQKSSDIKYDFVETSEGTTVTTTSKHVEKILDKFVKEVKDNNGNTIYKEYYVKSKDIPNKYDIYKEYSNGKKYKIGLVEATQAGDISIEKTLESSSGSKTQYFYIESPNGSRFVTTKILDKNGNVQYENSHKFKKINDNHYVSTENSKIYDIAYEESKIIVKDNNGNITELPIVENGQNGISKDLIQAIKLLPGSVLADIQKYGLVKISIGESENAHYDPKKNEIIISKEYATHSDLIFTLLHELGHFKDRATNIRKDNILRDTYEKERREFLAKNSETEFKEMEYFIENNDRRSILKDPIEEMIAEVNALLYSNNALPKIETRSAFLQEHFPQTYKLIAEKLQDQTVEKTKNNQFNMPDNLKLYSQESHMSDAEFAAKGKDILKLETPRITEKTISEIFNNSNLTDEQTDAILKDLGMTDKDIHFLHWNKTPNLNQIVAVLKHISDNSNMVQLSSSDLRFIIDKGVERTDINFIAQLMTNDKNLNIENILGNIIYRNYNKRGKDSYLLSEERQTRLDVAKQLLNLDKADLLTEILPKVWSNNKDTILDYYLNIDKVEKSTQDIIAQLKSLYPTNINIEDFVLTYAKTTEQKNVLRKLINDSNLYDVGAILEYMATSEEITKQISDFVSKEADLSVSDKITIIEQSKDGVPLKTAESEFIRIRDLRNSEDFQTITSKCHKMFGTYEGSKLEKFFEQNPSSLPKINKYLDLIAKNYTEYDHVFFSEFMKVLKEHPELENMFEDMIQMKDYDKTPRFEVFFIMKNILESASKSELHKNLIKDVLYEKEGNSENYKHEYYTVSTLATLIKDYSPAEVQTVKDLMSKNYTTSIMKEEKPFTISEISDMMEFTKTKDSRDALFSYIDSQKYNPKEIVELMKLHDKYPNQNELIQTLINMEFKQLPSEFTERKRFNISDIDELIGVYQQYPHEKEFIDDLLKRYDTFENGKLRGPRFESNQIATIVKLSNESKEAREIVKEYIEKSYTYDNGISRSFTGRELNAFVKYSLKSPSHKNIVDKLIERSNNEDCFESVMDAYDENPEYIESIIDMKKTDENGNRVPRFDIQALDYLKDLKYKELLQFEELDVNDIGHYVNFNSAREKLLNDEKYRTVVFTIGAKRWYDELNGDNMSRHFDHNEVGYCVDFLYRLCTDKNLGYTKDEISQLAGCMNGAYEPFIQRLCTDTSLGLSHKTIIDTLTALNLNSGMQASFKEKYYDLVYKICTEKELESAKDALPQITSMVEYSNFDKLEKLISNYRSLEITPNQITTLLSEDSGITLKQLQRLNRIMGRDKASKLNETDLKIACTFANLYGKQNINEIPNEGKKDLLHSMVASNIGLFEISDDLSREFPLIPKNQEEYCSLLPSIVRSLGIETNELTPEQRITMFNSSMGELSKSLAEISDTDFAKMTVTQEYPKDKFILDVLDKVKSLPRTERQKVYDYFGFELHHNKENSTGFSITGYPVNLNNGKKLAQIEDPRTKAVVEDLRPNVIRFSENNKIKCNNPQVERFLNEVIEALPELRTTIGKKQHGAQAFDVMQHSLKVMQKITQDPKFTTLNESDQKIMLLASLMHDITKSEGRVDKTHANEGSFDTYFIAQKFNLTKEEEVKLHTLIKNHEWLEYVNTAKSEDQLTKRLQSVAYDLHQGNLFDMAEIFTHADLRAVRTDDSFHDTTEGKSRIGFDGSVRSFGESANIYAERIRSYIKELQKSQPLLPQTKVPRASRINEAITQVNPDGSTNIKGVYKDKDGLVVIKFNEVEDWEAIGFPKGSISHGVEIKKGEKGDAELSEDVNTGNIKFFVHGLDYSNQLAKFDAFSLVDSDALLSVSYAERPESKFRFFRPQGVLLDVNSKYIHGGGNTDAGSGCGKDIAEFKNNYIFGGHRESDRLYISDLIKTATGMTDEQYVDFVEQNKDRPIQEIEPVEIRDKIIKAFATINSNTRKGKREYNEMYISNPNEVMGVFAYSMDYNETIGNPVNFLNRSSIGKYEKGYGTVGDISVRERTEFLRQYALERNLPFIIFGD